MLLSLWLKLDTREHNGNTMLHTAAVAARPQIVQFLLTRKADVHAVDLYGNTPLALVAGYRFRGRPGGDSVAQALATARLLIAAGADATARDNYGGTPLHDAASNGRTELARLFLASGADVNTRAKRNRSPLGGAARSMRMSFPGQDLRAVMELRSFSRDWRCGHSITIGSRMAASGKDTRTDV